MKMAPVSSFKLGMRPEIRELKNESGVQVKVSLEVENLWPPTFKLMISASLV